jgi:hypothetical protein
VTNRLRAPMSFAIAALLLLTGCRYLPAAGDSPAGVVTTAYEAIDAAGLGGYERLTDFACGAEADDVIALLGGDAASLSTLTAVGVDPKEVLDGTSVDFENFKATESSKTETAAKVRVTGTAKHTVDVAAFRAIVTKMLKDRGVKPTKKMLDQTTAEFADQLTSSQKMKFDVKLIQEDGKWVICG